MVGPHGGNNGSLVAAIQTAITAAVPPRTADAGNTRASAALPGGGSWDGAGRLTDDPGVFARVDADITCPVDAAGMFYVIHGPTVALVDGCNPAAPVLPCRVDAWPAVVVWAALRAPLTLRDKAYRLAWRGTAGSVVAIDATLDRRAVDHSTPILPEQVLAAGATTVNRPIGSRKYSAIGMVAGPNVLTLASWAHQQTAALAGLDFVDLAGRNHAEATRELRTTCASLLITIEATGIAGVSFYP